MNRVPITKLKIDCGFMHDMPGKPTGRAAALVRANGQVETVEWLGWLAKATPFSNDAAAALMVPVRRKKPTAR